MRRDLDLMSMENNYRVGIDENPLTDDEYERLKKGQSLYRHIVAPTKPLKITTNDMQ